MKLWKKSLNSIPMIMKVNGICKKNYIGFYVKRMVNGKKPYFLELFRQRVQVDHRREFKCKIFYYVKSVKNSFQEEYLLSSFPGKMKLIFLEQNEKREFYISNLKDCEFNFQALINEYYDYKTQLLQLQVDQEYDTQYLIQVWVQIDDVLSEFQTIQVIRLNLKYQLDEENHIDLTSFQITYISENSKWYYCLQFYSYIYPFIFSKTQIQDFTKNYQYEIGSEFLTSWHLIQVSYKNKQINYGMRNYLLNKQLLKQFENVNQFSCSKFTIVLGQNSGENLLSGQIQNLKYSTCPSSDNSIQFDHCHYSCQTCFGPNSNHCWSCDVRKNRIFNPKVNTCKCKLWYLDLDEVQCHGQSEFNLIETKIYLPEDTRYDEIQPIVQCAYGYFRYLDSCIQCPSASQKGAIQCLDCILYPDTWVQNGMCYQQYQQFDMDEQNTYRHIADAASPQSNFYLLIDEELFTCEDCVFCSKEEYLEEQEMGISYCILYPLKHMNQDTYIMCIYGNLDYETFKCQPQEVIERQNYGSYKGTCNEFCGYCSLRMCYYCKDTTLYFSDWQGICRVCNIEHCKYCFSYNQYDLNQVSARKVPYFKLPSNLEEDYIIGCSLCYSGYIFDFTINECVKKSLEFPCLNAFINQDNELICTSSSLTARITEEPLETIGCQTYFQFCVKCVSDNYKMVQCTKCEDGYYLNFKNGICKPCSEIIEHSIKCKMLTSSQDSWKYDVMSFYNKFLPDKIPILLSGQYFIVYYLIDECEEGYIYFYDECKIANDKNCLNWHNDINGVICKTCKSQSKFYQSSSFFNEKCQMCPYPCIICQERTLEEINLINPYFIVDEQTKSQTYYCIKNYGNQETYIHQKLGMIQPQTQNGARYVNKITKILNQNEFSSSQELKELEMQYLIQRNIYTYQAQYSFLPDEQIINLRNYIFSLQNQDLYYDGQNENYHEKIIQIFNQSKVTIDNLYFFNEKNILNITSKYGVEVFINNITLPSITNYRTLIEITNSTNLSMSYIQINEQINYQSSLISINNFYQQVFQNTNLLFYEITLLNCIFINSVFILINNHQSYVDKFVINNLRIINCTFENSSLFTFTQQSNFNKIIIKNISISNSKFINSEFAKIPLGNQIQMYQLELINSTITQGILIQSTQSTIFQELFFENVNLSNSTLLLLKGYLSETNFDHLFQKIQIKKISFQGQSPFKIIYRSDYKGQIKMQDIMLEQGSIIQDDRLYDFNASNCFFDFQSQSISITNFTGLNILNIQIFCLNNFDQIIIKDCIIKQKEQGLFNYDANKQVNNKGFLFIKDFIEIYLSNIQISNLYVVDSSLIYIQSKQDVTFNQSVVVHDFNVTNNVLVKSQLFTVPSLLYIQSEYYCNVELSKINYEHNLIKYQIEDSQIIAPSLLYIFVKQSKISLNSGQFKQNKIINSRNSHIYLNSETITLQSLIVSDINIDYQNQDLNFSNIQIYSQGGLGQLIGKNIVIFDVKFQNMMAHQGGCLLMVLLEKSRVLIENVVIQNAISWNNMSINSFGGSFYIDATNSELDLLIRNISVTLSISKDSGGFIYLLPSQISNKLKILNSNFINTFSQEQSLVSFVCDFFLSNNTFEFKNNTINIEESFYNDFLGMNFQSPQSSQSSLIAVSNSKINIDSVSITGSYSVSIFSLSFIHYLRLTNVKIIQAKSFGAAFISISNEQKYQLAYKTQNQLFLSEIDINNCQNVNQQTKGSFLDILLNAQITSKIQFHNLQIIQNNCSNCQNGLINLQFTEYTKSINFNQLLFFKNDCGFQSCLSATPIGTYQTTSIKVDHGLFIQNKGLMNGTLNLQASNLDLRNLKFIQNTASKGGGYYSQYYQELQTKNLYFIANKANIGGAIFLKSTKLQTSCFSQIYLIDNKGKVAIDNLQELPLQIMLSIFQTDIENIYVGGKYLPNLKKFLNENFIYLPSGQKIGQYQIYSQEQQNYQNYNIQLRFYFVNNLEEKILLFENETSSCTVNQQQFIGEQQQNGKYNDYVVEYDKEDQSFNFENLTIIFDPYSKKDSYLNLQMTCINQLKEVIKFQLNVKTFPCQVGEYYYESQCLLCEAKRGYYSLEPKASYCLKIDPKMIQKNTINQIELYPRYWRPSSKSSLISVCNRKPENCLGGWETGDDSCQLGSIGGLCEECDIYNIRGFGQYYQNSNFKCQYCQNFIGKAAISIVITILTLLSTYLTVNSAQLLFMNFKRLKYTTVHYKIIFRQGQDQSAALIKMIVNYFQILIGIKSFQIQMYSNIIDFLNPFSNPVGSSLYSYDCFYSQQSNVPVIYINLMINLLIPIFYYLLFITIYLIVILFKKAKLSITIYFTAILYLLFYTQPQIINELGSLAAKRQISGITYINKNVQYLYSTSTHNNWMTFCIIPLLVFEGGILPLIILLKLIKIRKHFNSDRFRKIWGYIFNDYQESCYYWEILRIFQRLIIILTLNFNEEQIITKGCIMFIILLFYFTAVFIQKPYNVKSLNGFELDSICLCEIIIVISCLKYQTQINQITSIDFLLEIIFIIFFMFLLLKVSIKLTIIYYYKYIERFDNIKRFLQYQFPGLTQKKSIISKFLNSKKNQRNQIQQRFLSAFSNLKQLKTHSSKLSQSNHQIKMSNIQNEHTLQLSCQFTNNNEKNENAFVKADDFSQCQDIVL
ncbi:unnamed protein product (macronuclear) [Paramecium tetraurelia]|uniref:Transmembrane protein n=1 Tax=Paramecium tetraurelia TaxID=5888 RepID=A0C054_PARTE|nr:uncharacterized protein GSPATT00006024001 [Paramecium tetraurelia]CAK64171.1 unnamed protein product [Paramecium tetraurelia]|eukprot:XP_001431569.1 hypothetical protein (macronuclear) [Paramecium tetraurelia strain d4-2]